MKKGVVLLASSLLLVSTLVWSNPLPIVKKNAKIYVSHFENVLGTSMEIKVKSVSEKQAELAETAAKNEIERLNKILSGYDKNSEFSKWMSTNNLAIKVSPELMEVLSLFDQWKKRTDGALDASAQVINQLWKDAAIQKTIPDQASINTALETVRAMHWMLDQTNQTAIHTSAAPLMLNSFAKSYIIQKANAAAMAVNDVQAVVVNIGGDIFVSGDLSEKVLVSDPKADAENDLPTDKLLVSNKAIATSGNYRRGVSIDGHWYSHIVDPRTGFPAEVVISATVISPKATDAGALATAFNVLTPAESERLAATIPGTEYLIITKDGSRIESKGWNKLTIHENKPVVSATSSFQAGQWNPDFELLINLELAQLQGFGRRPFVAIWVEDKDKKPVRNIALWFNKDRWLHELREWYSANFASFNGGGNNIGTISSATRSAGKYTMKWDGKDDKGNYVKSGKYTVYIEAAREHGTYQLMKQEIDFSNKPQQASLTGNVEVAGVSFDYKKKEN